MSAFLPTISSAVRSARVLGVTLKLSVLRDALSFALVNLPYSQATFTARQGRLPDYDASNPGFLDAAAERFRVHRAVLKSCLMTSDTPPMRGVAYFTIGPSPRHVVNTEGEIDTSDSDVESCPLYRFVYSDSRAEQAWGCCWDQTPSTDDVLIALKQAIGKLDSNVELVCPASVAKAHSAVLQAIEESFGLVARRPDTKEEMARSDVLGWDDQVMWLRHRLHDLGEGNPLIVEMDKVCKGSLFEIPKEDPKEFSLRRLYVGEELAKKICSLRGRSPDVQKLKRAHLPHSAPQAVAGIEPDAVDPVDQLIGALRGERFWVYDEDRLAIACMIKSWEQLPTSADVHRRMCEAEIGRAVFDFCVRYKRDVWSDLLIALETMFGSSHAYGQLMVDWCLREIAGSLSYQGFDFRGRGLRLAFESVSDGPWLKAVPLQEELSALLEDAKGVSAVLSPFFRTRGPSDQDHHWLVRGLITHAANHVANFYETYSYASPKARYISKSIEQPKILEIVEPLLLVGHAAFTEESVDLAPWVDKVNGALTKWESGFRLGSASIVDPLQWISRDLD